LAESPLEILPAGFWLSQKGRGPKHDGKGGVGMPKKSPRRTKEEQRHYTMSQIKSKDTKIETAFRKALWHEGARYRKNYKELPGTPDIAITKYRIAIFCDGDFWHGKDWQSKKHKLQGNRAYWIAKIERNMGRDNEVDKRLLAMGWVVLRFWGGDISRNLKSCVAEVQEVIWQAQMDCAELLEATPGFEG
jgi:DNA mismatch endonuclease (patch repair protein)